MEVRAGRESAFVIGTLVDIRSGFPGLTLAGTLEPDAFAITTSRANGVAYTVIAGGNDRGALYGVFAYLRRLSLGEPVAELNDRQAPCSHTLGESGTTWTVRSNAASGRSVFWERQVWMT
jgi:alpha-glucuronidase